jgi:hypothetical protein
VAAAADRAGSPGFLESVTVMSEDLKKKLFLLCGALLFAGVSIYFGTGWSTAIFQFPVLPKLTVADYYLHFIPQVDAATSFFKFLVTMMITTGLILAWAEWRTRYRWVPILVLLAVVAATLLTTLVVFPVNDILRQGIHDQAQLVQVMDRWKHLTEVRVVIWSFEWVVMMFYFGSKAYGRETGR